VTGGCLCGGVRFELEPLLRPVRVCHCSLCRRSGTLAGAYTAVPKAAFTLISDETLTWYVDENERQRGFCGRCGATLFWAARGRETISVSAGALDGATGLTIEQHIYVEDAADWESPST